MDYDQLTETEKTHVMEAVEILKANGWEVYDGFEDDHRIWYGLRKERTGIYLEGGVDTYILPDTMFRDLEDDE